MYARYVGKRPPESWQEAATVVEPPPLDKRWIFNGRMDLRIALRIFGLDKMPNAATLQARYRTLALENHPDRGGDVRVMAAINRAYGYLKL